MEQDLSTPSTALKSGSKATGLRDSDSESDEDSIVLENTSMTDHGKLVRLECNPQDAEVQTEPLDRRSIATQTSQHQDNGNHVRLEWTSQDVELQTETEDKRTIATQTSHSQEITSQRQPMILTVWNQFKMFLDSPYRAKIDESFYSTTFYALVHAKLWIIYTAVLLCIPVYFFCHVNCLVHFTLLGLLFIQALENKHVSPMAAHLFNLMAKYMKTMRTPDEESMREILKLQGSIRELLETYIVIEFILCYIIHKELTRQWDGMLCPYLYVCLAAPCLLELIATIGVYRQHYRSGGWEALRARFVF